MASILEIVDDIEVVEVPEATTNKMQRSAYAAVVFHNVAEMYPADAHVECSYTITSDITPSTRDWVGLYKVGWMSPNDYFYYEWAPYPKDYQPETDAQAKILYQAHNLPEDDGEFYQFCYVTSSGHIRGASTPFQFKRPSAGDYVEVEDEDNDMLIVQEKTVYLEENLKEAALQKACLLQTQDELEKEKKTLRLAVRDVKKKLRLKTTAYEEMKKELDEKTRELEDNNKNTKDLIVVHDELKLKVDTLTEEKAKCEKKIEKLLAALCELKEREKTLQNEKDELDGQNKSLKEEAEMIKGHLTKSEGTVSNYASEITTMKKDLEEKDSYIAACQMEIATLKSNLHQQSVEVEKSRHVMASNNESVEKLQERLRNTEDKLEAAVKVKELMTGELSAFTQKHEEIEKELQGRRTENLELKKNVERMESEFSRDCEILIRENEGMHRDLCNAVKEKEKLQKANNELQEEVKKDNTTGPMYALQVANDTLKHRHKQMKEDLNKSQAEMKSVKASASSLEKDLRREIEDLKERIKMCKDAYKQLYTENVKIQKRCKHCRNKVVNAEPSITSLFKSKDDKESVAMVTQSAESATSKDSLSDSGASLKDVKNKYSKYKKLFNEEKMKLEALREQYNEEMKQKDLEISNLRSTITARPTDLEHKLMSCISFLAEKDKQIDDLNHKLREMKQDQEEPKSPSKSQVSSPILFKPNYGYNYTQDFNQIARFTPLPPLIYPHIPPTALSSSSASSIVADHLSDSDNSEGLPKPISPTVLPSAKVAAVKASYLPFSDEQTDFVDAPSYFIKSHATAPLDLEEDAFVDAKGVGMKTCPECDKSFSPDISDEEFEQHILYHSGRICPVCNYIADEDTSDTTFEYHVNCCIDESKDA